ncbi:hypothetical protein BUALT_Bualt09G0139000 [Buddleja alternifolia]|uniref:Uncharacterized protein n=1 Tax=Buddleja alternifolia TaxID=168488 RepID=A0AAV6X439_9LAMI|nr:hypothetical protein BUALT_Bualt09G0139000 [Buddleja alternifolia]
MGRSSTFKEEIYHPPPDEGSSQSHSTSSTLAAQAIRASAAHRDSSHSSAYAAHSAINDYSSKGGPPTPTPTYDYTSSMGSSNEKAGGSFWGVLARKAKAILDDDDNHSEYLIHTMPEEDMFHPFRVEQVDISKKMENPTLRKGLDALTSSMNRIGGTIGNAFEEGRSIVENKTADFIQETRKIQIRRKGSNSEEQNFGSDANGPWPQSTQTQNQTSHEDQLKASRDVAMATAAKAKLLLRELKTVKADLAFAKQRCSQLEEENKILREAREKGVNPADDDMIRLQLETLLAEKARLAHENSVYARENRFLREIVEYHQLTMQDVVYLDEGIEEVTEVYPVPAVSGMLSVSPPSPASPPSPNVIPNTDTPPHEDTTTLS